MTFSNRLALVFQKVLVKNKMAAEILNRHMALVILWPNGDGILGIGDPVYDDVSANECH